MSWDLACSRATILPGYKIGLTIRLVMLSKVLSKIYTGRTWASNLLPFRTPSPTAGWPAGRANTAIQWPWGKWPTELLCWRMRVLGFPGPQPTPLPNPGLLAVSPAAWHCRKGAGCESAWGQSMWGQTPRHLHFLSQSWGHQSTAHVGFVLWFFASCSLNRDFPITEKLFFKDVYKRQETTDQREQVGS